MDAILDQADMLVLPSLADECLPYVILEAMAHRLPVVSTDVAGIPEMVVDGDTGLVVRQATVTRSPRPWPGWRRSRRMLGRWGDVGAGGCWSTSRRRPWSTRCHAC